MPELSAEKKQALNIALRNHSAELTRSLTAFREIRKRLAEKTTLLDINSLDDAIKAEQTLSHMRNMTDTFIVSLNT